MLANDSTQWKLNPPVAPHINKKWEVAVKSVKHYLQQTIFYTIFTYKNFTTFFVLVKALVNSQALSAFIKNSDNFSAFTLKHFV